jgi:hypothetical protein
MKFLQPIAIVVGLVVLANSAAVSLSRAACPMEKAADALCPGQWILCAGQDEMGCNALTGVRAADDPAEGKFSCATSAMQEECRDSTTPIPCNLQCSCKWENGVCGIDTMKPMVVVSTNGKYSSPCPLGAAQQPDNP